MGGGKRSGGAGGRGVDGYYLIESSSQSRIDYSMLHVIWRLSVILGASKLNN